MGWRDSYVWSSGCTWWSWVHAAGWGVQLTWRHPDSLMLLLLSVLSVLLTDYKFKFACCEVIIAIKAFLSCLVASGKHLLGWWSPHRCWDSTTIVWAFEEDDDELCARTMPVGSMTFITSILAVAAGTSSVNPGSVVLCCFHSWRFHRLNLTLSV